VVEFQQHPGDIQTDNITALRTIVAVAAITTTIAGGEIALQDITTCFLVVVVSGQVDAEKQSQHDAKCHDEHCCGNEEPCFEFV
jgi:hypothetical protein